MNRRSLGVLAILLIVLMAIVATAGLDNLPRRVRDSVAATSAQLDTDRNQLQQHREFVEKALRDEPVLFRTKADDWRRRLQQDQGRLESAVSLRSTLNELVKVNKRSDAAKVTSGLSQIESLRSPALQDAAGIRAEAERWIGYKRDLPKRQESFRASYEALHAFDIAAATQAVQKAMVDWPAKKEDLNRRLDQLRAIQAQGEQIWASSSPVGQVTPEAATSQDFDYAGFFQKADALEQASREVKEGAATVNALASQLYANWDKLLLELDEDNGNRQKVRVVRTQYADASLKGGQTSSEEKWETIDAARLRASERNVGMVIERKATGRYDSEAERTAQAPAYAYVAAPGQSNAYGSWQNGVWHWLPQYMLLSTLLNSSRGSVTTGDYYDYDRARRRGETWYGRNNQSGGWHRHSSRSSERIGGVLDRAKDWARSRQSAESSGGGFYRERSKPSFGSQGYSGSRYKSRGGFSGSRYQSRGGFGSRSFSRSFGRRR